MTPSRKMALRDQQSRLAEIAAGWLARGAHRFAIYPAGGEPLLWPDGAPHREPTLRVPVMVNGGEFGQLEICGLDSALMGEELHLTATLVGELLRLEEELQLMAAHLVATQDQLLSLYNLAELGQKRLGLHDVLRQVVKRASPLFPVEGAFALVHTSGWPLLIEHHPSPIISQRRLDWVLAQIGEGRSELWWRSDEPEDGLRNLLVLTVTLEDAVTVAVGLVNKDADAYTVPDVRLAQAIAEHGATQVENVLLYEQTLRQARLQAEMELAHSVQLNLLPERAPHVPGLQIWAYSRPASQVGGDFYDFMADGAQPFTFAVGDVSGKGMPAALLMAMTRAVIRAYLKARPDLSPDSIVARTNSALYSDFGHVGMFATLFVARFDPQARELLYANAGHSPVVYCRAGEPPHLLVADGTALGILPTSFSANQRLRLHAGDLLVVATDGFSEAWNSEQELYGYERLLALVHDCAARPADEIGQALYQAVDRFSMTQNDDQTLLVVKGTSR